MTAIAVTVSGLHPMIPPARLLGPTFRPTGETWTADLAPAAAADVAARLRALTLAGSRLEVTLLPKLGRDAIRAARTRDAVARRNTTPRGDLRVDEVGRIGASPAKLADALAARWSGAVVVDAMAGCGGDALAFARAGCRVTAIEIDPGRAALLRENARAARLAITVLQTDARIALEGLSGDLLHVDPPWDDLPSLHGVWAHRHRFGDATAKLPPHFDPNVLPSCSWEPVFGLAEGDRHRVKWLHATYKGRPNQGWRA